MYNKIYDFCKVRNFGGIYKNTSDKPQPRVLFLLDLLESEGIEYTLDKFDFNSGFGVFLNFQPSMKAKLPTLGYYRNREIPTY